MAWILTPGSLWSVRVCLKGRVPCTRWSYIDGGECTITLYNSHSRKLKTATDHCSENTHYIFRFWKWNSIQKILSFCMKIADRISVSLLPGVRNRCVEFCMCAYPHASFAVRVACMYIFSHSKSSCLDLQTPCVQNAAVYTCCLPNADKCVHNCCKIRVCCIYTERYRHLRLY